MSISRSFNNNLYASTDSFISSYETAPEERGIFSFTIKHSGMKQGSHKGMTKGHVYSLNEENWGHSQHLQGNTSSVSALLLTNYST